jgi:hypothetical protein
VVSETEAIRQGSQRSYELTCDEPSRRVASLALGTYCWQQEQRPEESLAKAQRASAPCLADRFQRSLSFQSMGQLFVELRPAELPFFSIDRFQLNIR